jgi:hypothetical protein
MRFLVTAAIAGAILTACDQPTSPTAPRLNADVLSSDLTALFDQMDVPILTPGFGEKGVTVGGTVMNPEKTTIALSAIRHQDGTVSGEMQMVFRSGASIGL